VLRFLVRSVALKEPMLNRSDTLAQTFLK